MLLSKNILDIIQQLLGFKNQKNNPFKEKGGFLATQDHIVQHSRIIAKDSRNRTASVVYN